MKGTGEYHTSKPGTAIFQRDFPTRFSNGATVSDGVISMAGIDKFLSAQ
jgi:hypothetical protein